MCLSLAIEALTQGSKSRKPHGIVLRALVFQNPLPSTKTDEVVELQTSIQATRSRDTQEQTYLVAIESVRDGLWTTHCEGTAVVSANLNGGLSNGIGPLESVGNFGRDTMTLKRIMVEGSDPYQLHPLTIYRCLQHALAFAASKEHDLGDDCGNLRSGSSDGLKVVEIEEFRVWESEERASGENWAVRAVHRDAVLRAQVAKVDIDLRDETGTVAATMLGLQVTKCEGEKLEAFDKDLPPPEPNARVPAFLRPLLK